ncbi:N4-gp56 family major capsid protein [Zhongshania sp.]|uniref:N4-gp56 family major capsid protein n=1 Tax=Zhongshania sp. TaxID=1971902 RepID=UPI003565E8BB
MTKTAIPFGDAKAVKRWGGRLAVDVAKKSYFERKFIGTDQNALIQRKTELESDAGDNISFDLSVQLRGKPTEGDRRLKGNEEQLKFYTDNVSIDQIRKSVSAGGRMSRKRTVHDLRSVGKERSSEYWSRYIDEMSFVYLSGARGINQDFIEDVDWTGRANNALVAPDTDHILYAGSATSKATVAATDKMDRQLIERAATKAHMMQAKNPNTANMVPISINGEDHYVCLMSPFQEYDLRTSEGSQAWLEIQKQAAAAEGRNNPIFRGGLGMINNVVLHSHRNSIRFNDYGAGTNLDAGRALFMGRQAGIIAYGTNGGMRFDWKEEWEDFDNEPVVASGTILGFKKSQFNGKDFGVLSLDTYAKDPN